MATYSLANERLRALEDIEREIGAILQNAGSGRDGGTCAARRQAVGTGGSPSARAAGRVPGRVPGRGSTRPAPPSLRPAGTVILELSKEKSNERLLDRQAAAFTASVQHVEAELSAQIRYLTQVCVLGGPARPPGPPPKR